MPTKNKSRQTCTIKCSWHTQIAWRSCSSQCITARHMAPTGGSMPSLPRHSSSSATWKPSLALSPKASQVLLPLELDVFWQVAHEVFQEPAWKRSQTKGSKELTCCYLTACPSPVHLPGADLTGKKWSSQKKMKKSTNPKPTIAQPQHSHIQTCCESCALHTQCK